MSRIIETTIYTIDELSDEAKDAAHDNYLETFEYFWEHEALNSLKALALHFGSRLTDWTIHYDGYGGSYASFSTPDWTSVEITDSLAELGTFDPETLRGNGDCKLTGYCADEDAIDGFRRAFLAGETDLDVLLQAAFETWLDALQADYRYNTTMEAFVEHAEANGYEYTENGSFYQS